MAKIKVHELAKELELQSKDILSFLQEKGIEAKAAQSSLEEDAAALVRNSLGKKKAAAPAAQKAPVNTENAKPAEEKAQAPAGEAKAQETKVSEETKSTEETKKKKKIIFVSNPQNSKMPGQRQGGQSGQGQRNAGGQRPNQGGRYQNNGYQNNSYGNRVQAQAPVRPIKPLTPPSPTPSVAMVPGNRGQQPAKKPQTQAPVKEQAVQNTAAAQAPQAAQPAQNVAQTRPADRPQNGNRDNRDNRQGGYGQNNRDNRGQNERGQGGYNRDNRDGNRDNRQGGYGQGNRQGGQNGNRGGMGNGRPQGGGFNRQGRPGMEGGQGDRRGNGNGERGYGNNGRDQRGNGGSGNRFGDNRQNKGFAPEPAGKDLEKKREDEKRRFSQEKDNKRSKKDHIYEDEDALKNKPGRFIKPEKKKEEVQEEQIKVIVLPESITIKELAEKMKLQPAAIIKKLFLEGKIVTVNQEISYEDAENIAMEYDILCEKEVKVDVIEELLKEDEEDEADLVERPPVICVMGHVDHGKTSLLDAIRKTNVTDREAGGITQHIGAYTVNVGDRKITFLDTPGHEAFTAMRMRGANATDIAILVVAADDGVMPQTVEAINHAKAAGVEIIVAVNKIDKPSANIDRVKQELAEYELIPEDWGGSTVFAPVSAKSGEGIDQLLDMILLTADIMELKANPKRKARGLVIEAELDKGRGPVATVLVQKGTLHVGDFISAGVAHGKVRAMIDDKGRRVKEAGPSTPVEILGLSDVPSAGEVFLAHDNDKTAKSYAETYLAQNKEKMLEETKGRMSLDDLFSQIQAGEMKTLNIIVKADVQGSAEAVKASLEKLSNEEVRVRVIHCAVGAISESDVMLATTSNAIIVGFNVRPDNNAKESAARNNVDMRMYRVIYDCINEIETAMKGMLAPKFKEVELGQAEVRNVFRITGVGMVAGCYVTNGKMQRGAQMRLLRDNIVIYDGAIASLQRFKDSVREVAQGYECGITFEKFQDIKVGDVIECFIMEQIEV